MRYLIFINLFLNIFLNLQSKLHIFSSMSQLFHSFSLHVLFDMMPLFIYLKMYIIYHILWDCFLYYAVLSMIGYLYCQRHLLVIVIWPLSMAQSLNEVWLTMCSWFIKNEWWIRSSLLCNWLQFTFRSLNTSAALSGSTQWENFG